MRTELKRPVARVILLDKDRNVLLVKYSDTVSLDPERLEPLSYWVPPGGALLEGEDHYAAAARELKEETGLDIQVGQPIWERELTLEIQGQPVRQVEVFFYVALDEATPAVTNTSPEPIIELRWWSLDELESSGEVIFPEGFVQHVAPILAGELPSSILRLGSGTETFAKKSC